MIAFKSLKEKLSISRYVKHFDKKNFSQTIGFILSALTVDHISRHNFNMWFSFFIFNDTASGLRIILFYTVKNN